MAGIWQDIDASQVNTAANIADARRQQQMFPLQMQQAQMQMQQQKMAMEKAQQDQRNQQMGDQAAAQGMISGSAYPKVDPVTGMKQPEQATIPLQRLTQSLIAKNPNLANNPTALFGALEKFKPMLEQQDKMQLQQMQNRAKVEEAGAIETAKKTADLAAKKEAAQPKAESTMNRLVDNADDALKTIDDVSGKADAWTTGFVGSVARHVPGTDAYDLAANVERLQSRLGLDTLQEIKDSSPNGSALGRVTNYEMGILVKAKENLDQAQSPSQFKAALADLKTKVANSKKHVREAYDETYGDKASAASGLDKADPRVQAALQAGYSEAEIQQFLSKK